MTVEIDPTGYGTTGWVVGAFQDSVGWYLDALAVGDDPIVTRGIGLVIDRFAISVRRAAPGLCGIEEFSRIEPRDPEAAMPISKLVPRLMSLQIGARDQQRGGGGYNLHRAGAITGFT